VDFLVRSNVLLSLEVAMLGKPLIAIRFFGFGLVVIAAAILRGLLLQALKHSHPVSSFASCVTLLYFLFQWSIFTFAAAICPFD
jgi:hypothetical protein